MADDPRRAALRPSWPWETPVAFILDEGLHCTHMYITVPESLGCFNGKGSTQGEMRWVRCERRSRGRTFPSHVTLARSVKFKLKSHILPRPTTLLSFLSSPSIFHPKLYKGKTWKLELSSIMNLYRLMLSWCIILPPNMSPARITKQSSQDQQVETLTRGFDALLETVRSLALKEKDLQLKLKFAHDEVRTLLSFDHLSL